MIKYSIYLILHVMGIFTFFTRVVNMAFAFSGFNNNAAPIPPFSEKAFGHLRISELLNVNNSFMFFKKKFTPYLCL